MFQSQSAPFSSPFFSASISSPPYGLDIAPVFGLSPQPAHAGDGTSPTEGETQLHYLVHSNNSSSNSASARSSSSSCAAAALNQQNHFRLNQQLPSQLPPQALPVGGRHRQRPIRQAASMEEHSGHDMAAQQEAAKGYQPDLRGPLVGAKSPSDAITSEYAKADQIYVEKTIALPQTYSHYRPVQGDGNCGWRAIGFSYFEKLVEYGDQNRVEGEVARLKSLNHLLATVGGYDYFEDFAEEVFDLLRQVARTMDNPEAAHSLILQTWNDKHVEGSLIFYFRLLAATYLKANAATYEPFIQGGLNVATYCNQNIEVVNREIEHVGIVALVNILLKPVDFVLEIAYLDRSPGALVNQYRFPEEANEKDASTLGPVIYLLYRPNHYDILYRLSSPMRTQILVNRAAQLSHQTAFTDTAASLGSYSTADFGALSLIPGISAGAGDSLAGMMSITSPSSDGSPLVGNCFTPTQQGGWITQFGSEIQPTKAESPNQRQAAIPTVQQASPAASLTPTTSLSSTPSIMPATANMPSQQLPPHVPAAAPAGYPIRFSSHQLEYESNSFPEPTFQVTTNTFKNSVWNRAHYGNPDFQPEEWNPEEDSIDNRLGGKRKNKKES